MPLDAAATEAITYQEERFTDLREEGAHLFHAHWQEASPDLSVPLNVGWDHYRTMEDCGFMFTMTVRRGGVLVGYVVYIIWPHLHYQQMLIADTDSFFLDPSASHGWIGINLFRNAEAVLRERGVHQAWARVKMHVRRGRRRRRDLSSLFRWLGYVPVEMSFRKRLR